MIPYIVAAVLLIVFLYILMLLPSRAKKDAVSPFTDTFYAHRGLYSEDQTIAENTLEAFQRACEKGYGVEMDIRLSKDGQIVVFHDDTLMRAAGIDRPVEDFTWQELSQIPLYGTEARIPLFREVLEVIDGQIPLIIELKTGTQNRKLCEDACAILRRYKGPYCVESFDPRIIRWFKKNAPEVVRGQLACSVSKAGNGTPRIVAFLASRCLLNFLSRPNFIAYELVRRKPMSVRLSESLGALPVCWTSHDPKDVKGNRLVIFEHYEPPKSFVPGKR